MTDPQSRATSYLAPTVDAFWRWSADGEVLTWTDGKTIAFRPEVQAVLTRMAPHGLPPFGAVAMLLAACREGWGKSGGREFVREYASMFDEWLARASAAASEPSPLHPDRVTLARTARAAGNVVDGLDTIARLPAGLREGVEAKAVLAETVFEQATKRLGAADAAQVIEALRDGVNPEGLLPRLSTRESLSQFAEDVDGLRPGLSGVSEETLSLRVRTGLDQLVGPADLDLAPSERVRRLLAELRQDKELAGLARLAQDLMAAVHVPRTLHVQDELPLGGVSDLSNRGPLDRLLTSELAHDDLTLAVRVATNEALFLRRESPPRQPPSRRAILIDVGLRMWGIPRVFATAVALALIATADKKAQLLTYRATHAGIEAADLTTRRGLIEFLGALEPSPQPGASLKPFFDRLAEREQGLTDALLVTHPDVLSDPDFAAALGSLEEAALYVATVARDGAFNLQAMSRTGRKPVRGAVLSLDAILERPKDAKDGPRMPAGTPLRVKGIDPTLPVILSTERFPLLLPHVVEPRFATVSKRHGLVAATKDGRLLHWSGNRRGARQLTALLPRGQARGVFVHDQTGTASVVLAHRRTAQTHLVTADLASGRCTSVRLESEYPEPQGVAARGGVLFLIYENRVAAIDVTTGRPVGSARLPEQSLWRGGRFISSPRQQWHALAFDGTRVVLEPLPKHALMPPAALFDRHEADGPLALLWDALVVGPEGKPVKAHGRDFGAVHKLAAVAPDGSRIAIETDRGPFLLDLSTGSAARWEKLYADPYAAVLAPQIHWSLRCPVMARARFRGIFAGSRGELWLRTKQGTELVCGMNDRRQLILMERGHAPAPPGMREFGHTTRVPGSRFDLHVATWADGSRAFLDSRGMLHLKSSDPAVPEITLVLSNEKLAGWSSEGKVFGSPFFIGEAVATDAAYFEDAIRRFTGRLR